VLQRISRVVVSCVIIIGLAPVQLFAAGGTTSVATKGNPAAVSADWPAGVGEIVNDPARTSGWNSWFTEWPNDVNQYGFEIATNDDLIRLIHKLASVKSEVRQIRLSHLKEPQTLGWVTSLPKGNNIAVIFSIGDQSRIDEWYKHVRKPFGTMEFLAAPVAVPPTLTIFVQNDAINLETLQIPKGITVSSGNAPTLFHRSNTAAEKKREDESAKESKVSPDSEQGTLDPAARTAADKIIAFLRKHDDGDANTE
jgi:hypothetical protein